MIATPETIWLPRWQGLARHTCAEVGDERDGGDLEPFRARHDDLWHCRHADGIGPGEPGKPDLRRRLEGRAREPHVDALGKRDARFARRRTHVIGQQRIIGIDEIDEALVARNADHRIEAREGDMVGDQHRGAGANLCPERSGGIRQDQALRAKTGEHLHRHRHFTRIAMLIIMSAPGKDRDRYIRQCTEEKFARMA